MERRLVDSRKVNVDFSLENFNLPKSENARQPQCTPEKEEAKKGHSLTVIITGQGMSFLAALECLKDNVMILRGLRLIKIIPILSNLKIRMDGIIVQIEKITFS